MKGFRKPWSNHKDVRRRNRTWTITARPGAQESYGRKMPWTMRAPDLIAGGPERYVDNVRAWARGSWEVLRAE